MKKLLSVLISLVILISLSACSSKHNKKIGINFLSETQLTDKERMFLSVAANGYFAFDFSIEEKYKWLEVWVERYEDGKKVSSIVKTSTTLSQCKEGMILITVNELEKGNNEWTIAVKNDTGISTGKSKEEYKNMEICNYLKTWGTNSSPRISTNNNEIILGSICYKEQKNGNSMNSLTTEFYNNPDDNIEEIANYDVVYLLKGRFYEHDTE